MPFTHDLTRELLNKTGEDCYEFSQYYGQIHPDGEPNGGCPIAWDNVMCWNATPPGTVVRRLCPAYICGFNTTGYAERTCMEDGQWASNGNISSWTNYSACLILDREDGGLCLETFHDRNSHLENGDKIRLLYTVGYSVSLASLVIAVIIMLYWKRLHCKSNSLHINLFLAFIMRAFMAFIKDRLFVANLGFPKDVQKNDDGIYEFIDDGPHWECRALYVLFMFAISASQTWILMEGLYLILLIHKTILTERLGVKPYIILGWRPIIPDGEYFAKSEEAKTSALPWAFHIPWVVVKATYENTFCWNIQENPAYFWILKGPWTSIVVLNFFFFLDIIRVLLIRVRNNQRHAGQSRSQYRKFAKFILVLIPLFGIMYIVMYVAVPKEAHGTEYDVFYLYIEMGYNSFQGFILALLFCFLNEDVHAELRRSWQSRRSRRLNHSMLKRSLARSSWNGGHSTNTSITHNCHKTKLSFRSHPRAKNALSWSPASEDTVPLNVRTTATPVVTRNSYSSLKSNGQNGVALEKGDIENTADV